MKPKQSTWHRGLGIKANPKKKPSGKLKHRQFRQLAQGHTVEQKYKFQAVFKALFLPGSFSVNSPRTKSPSTGPQDSCCLGLRGGFPYLQLRTTEVPQQQRRATQQVNQVPSKQLWGARGEAS